MPAIEAFNTEQELQDSPIREAWITSGRPRARNRLLFRSTDKSSWTILWDCSAGCFDWHYSFDETIHFLEGGVTITLQGGMPQIFKAGDVIFFPAGAVAHWEVERYVRKLAVCQNPLPKAFNLPLKLVRRLSRKFGRGASLVTGLLGETGPAEAAGPLENQSSQSLSAPVQR